MLAKDAFTNFSTIMKDVSLSPAMGGYLNMLNSNKPAAGQIANENYRRELMQLFTTGIDLLNPDGTLQLDSSGNPIPVYTRTKCRLSPAPILDGPTPPRRSRFYQVS